MMNICIEAKVFFENSESLELQKTVIQFKNYFKRESAKIDSLNKKEFETIDIDLRNVIKILERLKKAEKDTFNFLECYLKF